MKLRTKLIILLGILSGLLAGGTVYFLNSYIENYIKDQFSKNFNILAEVSEGTYFTFIETMKVRILDWSSDGYIMNATEQILNSSGSKQELLKKELSAYLREKKMIYDPTVIIIDILDGNGVVVASSRDDRIGVNEKEEEERLGAHRFSEAIESDFGKSFVTNFIIESDEYDEPMIHLVTRIFSIKEIYDKKPTPLNAVMLLHFANTKQLGNVLSGKWQIEKGTVSGNALFEHYKTSDIYLVNKDYLMVSQSRLNPEQMFKQKVDTLPIKTCFERGEEVSEEYLNYAGRSVFGASMCLKRDNLALVIEVDREEIFTPLKTLTLRLTLAGFVFFILNILSIFFVVNWVLKNINKVIVAAEKISKNDFSARADVKSNDEIGYLASAFNKMLNNVENSRRELELSKNQLKEINFVLESAVKERTKELEELKNSLEKSVASRTKELNEKIAELEKFKELTVGRELKMMELKKEIEKLKK